jgi:hypothetical protein
MLKSVVWRRSLLVVALMLTTTPAFAQREVRRTGEQEVPLWTDAFMFAGNFGVYLGGQQRLIAFDSDGRRGLAMVAQFGWAPDDRNLIGRYVGAGLVALHLSLPVPTIRLVSGLPRYDSAATGPT